MSWFKRECKHQATGYRGADPYIFQKYSQVDGIGRLPNCVSILRYVRKFNGL